jgi:hypothetical protein
MQKNVPAPVEQCYRTIEGYDKTVESLIDELIQMSEKEFDLFLDCIEIKRNKKLTKFVIWIYNNRKCVYS